MNKLRIEDPWSQDESEGESVAAPSVSTVHAPAKGSVSGFVSDPILLPSKVLYTLTLVLHTELNHSTSLRC